jgi:hypothetical protein
VEGQATDEVTVVDAPDSSALAIDSVETVTPSILNSTGIAAPAGVATLPWLVTVAENTTCLPAVGKVGSMPTFVTARSGKLVKLLVVCVVPLFDVAIKLIGFLDENVDSQLVSISAEISAQTNKKTVKLRPIFMIVPARNGFKNVSRVTAKTSVLAEK